MRKFLFAAVAVLAWNVLSINRAVDLSSTCQFDTIIDLRPHKERSARPDSASAPGFSSAAVLHADKTTQSALSLSFARLHSPAATRRQNQSVWPEW